jgi:thiamine phosphate synthase YjbQ (UPF0047 family)
MLDITTQVAEKVKREGLKEGTCMIYCTAGYFKSFRKARSL